MTPKKFDPKEPPKLIVDHEHEMLNVQPPSDREGRVFHNPLPQKRTLADDFVSCTHEVAGALKAKGKHAKAIDELMRRLRIDMNKTRRFVLDDDFTRMSTIAASTTNAEKLLVRLQYATLPYEYTWIELDLHVRMQTMQALHRDTKDRLKDVSPRCGFLLYRLSDTEGLCCMVSDWGESMGLKGWPKTMMHLTGWFWSTVEHDFVDDKPVHGCDAFASKYVFKDEKDKGDYVHKMVDEEELRKQVNTAGNIAKHSLWGIKAESSEKMGGFVADLDDLSTPKFLFRHGDAAFTRMYMAFVHGFGTYSDAVTQVTHAELTEYAGTMRYVVTVLAMLNEIPIHTQHMPSPGKGWAGRNSTRTLFDYHRVSLRVPRVNPLKYIERTLNPGRKRRAHEVRSHWRTYLHEKSCLRDEHRWEYDHENGYRLCDKCMAFSRLIREHLRGDPSLGWVRKDYVVKSAL